jgi:predicted transposase/invertase (TIGR01784 family)
VADERARIAYQQREKFLRDQANYIHTAKMEGLAAGRAEMKQETARKMKKLGIPLQQITDVTGLSEEELGKI